MRLDNLEGTPQARVDGARHDRKPLRPLVAKKAKQYKGQTLEQLNTQWAEALRRQGGGASSYESKVELLAIFLALGSKARKSA